MIIFIKSVHGNHANRLLQAILTDLKNPVYMAGCKVVMGDIKNFSLQ